jgi:hypothetical protein
MKESIYKKEKEELLKVTNLPKWVLNAISYIAYEDGHSAGMSEVDSIELGMIRTFERHMNEMDC